MTNSIMACRPALLAGLALWLAASAPASAGLFDFPAPPRAYSSAHEANMGRPHAAKVQRKRHHPGARHKEEARRELPPARGPFQIIVEIAKQQVALYGRDGFIARASISTGMPRHPTPLGVFTVISKARWHRSNIYSGAPMPYMQRLTWSGIALHAGPRPGYPASHGCIRLPEDFAIRLFHLTKVGARVIVTREPAAPVAISNPKLFEPLPPPKVAELTTPGKATDGSDAHDATQPVTTADLSAKISLPPAEMKPAKRPPPVSVFVSRKQGKVFVRQGFKSLFDMPATIADPDRPLGTHVFTAMGLQDDGKAMRWTEITVPSHTPRAAKAERKHHHGHKLAETEAPLPPASTAAQALDRITLPPEAIARISALLVPGSSLIVSDNALSDETDADTDFIVLTP